MNTVKYQAVKELHFLQEIGEYTAWGIKGSCSSEEESGTTSIYISDIFLNEKKAKDFARRCTLMKLSLIHLKDVVADNLD